MSVDAEIKNYINALKSLDIVYLTTILIVISVGMTYVKKLKFKVLTKFYYFIEIIFLLKLHQILLVT